MRHSIAIKTCANWHNGQWSAFYQFASSGVYLIENHLLYLKEVEECLHPEYALYPSTLSKKDSKDLEDLKQFFISQGNKHKIYTQYKKHEFYGYLIPFACDEIGNRVISLKYPI